MSLKIKNLSGGYGQLTVLKDVSFTVPDGTLTALVGLNGSGKSTTINHIIGLLNPKQGDITLNDYLLTQKPITYKAQIAYIPEQPVVYEELTLKEHLSLTMAAYHLDEKVAWQRADKLLKMFRLEDKLNWFPTHFSKGMRQKVMIVMAFITDAKLFIIDEPFLGLDVIAVNDLLALIDERKQQGVTFLLTTHVLHTIEKHADQFVYLKDGQVAAQGAMTDFATLVPELTVDEG
ncbi:ABC transporter ATP-binding protein [Weissella sagaensis]|jgi:ABC-2 type transport system ATP-binding protein|uniref:ABC transporter ATP-binding protein n=1 Tax=Weissella sagaensis TaxID=2559928 RepID=A0ABW1RTE4_9LACO|nr:ABC transporter ATP-binding protein [Weissella sagaensis]MBU7567933.1 ABC transporter ATP-binding protein [Weissella hellenica]QDJ58826.1 ABC transporter ATP-binding protein [Weissella hellenica]QEA57785.1 ABC transporter ATP-binding protein [Weissella hellenica]UEG66919.1 ABC transporter ATP-binding protein [Weissella hellenica]